MMKKRMILILIAAVTLLVFSLSIQAAAEEDASLLRNDHCVYLNGYKDGQFLPERSLSRAEGCAIFYKLLADTSRGVGASDYPDVESDSWFYEAITVLSSRGFLGGQGEAFRPNDPMTRAELAELLTVLAQDTGDAALNYTDVSEDDPSAAAIAAVSAKGWLRGFEDGSFRPGEAITRGQAAAVFNRILNRSADRQALSANDACRFTDISPENWYYAEVMEAAVAHETDETAEGAERWSSYTHCYVLSFAVDGQLTYILTMEGTLPQGVPSRNAEGRSIIGWIDSNGAEARPLNDYPVRNETYYAVYAPDLITEHVQYIRGYEDGTFHPEDSVTRAQAAGVFYNLLADQSMGTFPSALSDVPMGAWYVTPVCTLVSRGLMPAEGKSFRPNAALSRGDLALFLSKLTSSVANQSFADVSAGSPLCHAVSAVCARGWMSVDSNGRFRPDEPVTRAELVHCLNSLLNRAADTESARLADERYRFSDVPSDHWAYADILEASTTHSFTSDEQGEHWSEYRHEIEAPVWEHSAPVTAAATIINQVSCEYHGTWDYSYNVDYSHRFKEEYVNWKNYSSQTPYLIWVSIQNQKASMFTGEPGNWKVADTWICATGLPSSPTPVGVSTIFIHGSALLSDHYACYPVVGFAAGSGCCFHSRLHRPYGLPGWYDDMIGRPRSGGCIRMFDEDAQYIYDEIPLGTTVVVY